MDRAFYGVYTVIYHVFAMFSSHRRPGRILATRAYEDTKNRSSAAFFGAEDMMSSSQMKEIGYFSVIPEVLFQRSDAQPLVLLLLPWA